MARLGDVPVVLRAIGPLELVRRVWREVDDDHLFAWAAALAYSWLFSVFPFLIALLSLMSWLPPEAKEHLKDAIEVTLPQEAAELIWSNVMMVLSRPRRGLLGLGILLTLWGASGGMNVTITALERCYEIERGRSYHRKRAVAVGLTLVTAVLVLLVLVLLPVGTLAIRWVEAQGWAVGGHRLGGFWLVKIVRYPLALLVMFAILNVLYHYGPSIRQRFVFASPGAVFCVVAWITLGLGFRLYVNHFGRYSETYGTVGGIVVLLLLFYLDAVVLLVGAEINSEIDYEVLGVPRGSRDFRIRQSPGTRATP